MPAALGLVLLCILGYLWYVASQIQVDYYDTFFLFVNSKTIARGGGLYDYHRFIFPCMVDALWFRLEDLLHWRGFGFRVTHLLNVGYFALILATLYRMYRRGFSWEWALTGVFFFATIPILSHYAPTAKEDVLAALLLLLAQWTYLSDRPTLCGICTGLAMASRYNLIPILPGFFLLYGIASKPWKKMSREVFVLLIALAVFAALPTILYPIIHRSSLLGAFPLFLKELWVQIEDNVPTYLPPITFFVFFLLAMGVPALLMVFLGAFFSLREREKKDVLFHGLWILSYLFFQAFLVNGKEVRYLFPVFPSIAFFILIGAQRVLQAPRPSLVFRGGVLALFVLWAMGRTWGELRKFRDPFYSTPFEQEVSLRAKDLAKGNNIYWIGSFYGIHPKNYIFHPDDRYAYLYHFHAHVVQFFADQDVIVLQGGTVLPTENSEKRKWAYLPGVGMLANDGDVFIANPERHNLVTRDVTEVTLPLVVQRARIRSVRPKFDGRTAKVQGLSDGEYEWYGRRAKEPWQTLGIFSVKEGNVALPYSNGFEEFRALDFDVVEEFASPSTPFNPTPEKPLVISESGGGGEISPVFY